MDKNKLYIQFGGNNEISNGFVIVHRQNNGRIEANYMNGNGEILSPMWFSSCEPFSNGFAVVHDFTNKYNYIKPDGTLLSPTFWFDYCYYFNKFGRAIVQVDHMASLENVIKEDGSFLFNNHLSGIGKFDADGYFSVRNHDQKWNVADKDGNFIFHTWYDFAHRVNGLVEVEINGESTLYDMNENRVNNITFDYIYQVFSNNFLVIVKRNNLSNQKKYNVVNKEGKIISPNLWFDAVNILNDQVFRVVNNGLQNYLRTDGTLMFTKWYANSSVLFNARGN